MKFTTATVNVNMSMTTVKAVLLQLQHRLPGENLKAHFGHILDQVSLSLTTRGGYPPVVEPGTPADVFRITKDYIDYVESYRK